MKESIQTVFIFYDGPVQGSQPPIPISKSPTNHKSIREYLVVEHKGKQELYEIHLEYRCSPFGDVLRLDDLLAIGREDCFFLFNTVTGTLLLDLTMEGYFSSLHYQHNKFFVTDTGGVYCIENSGHISWKSPRLGIDGVVIHDFTGSKIRGSGEWDPPGGWKDFVLDVRTGEFK